MTNIKITGFAPTNHLYQSAWLYRNARKLIQFAENDEPERDTYVLSAVLVIAAACEALLSEYASIENPNLYAKKSFKLAGIPGKYTQITSKESEELEWVNWFRNSIVRSEPDNVRSTQYGKYLNFEGASRALKTLENLAKEIWQNGYPEWLEAAIEEKTDTDPVA